MQEASTERLLLLSLGLLLEAATATAAVGTLRLVLLGRRVLLPLLPPEHLGVLGVDREEEVAVCDEL